VKWQLPRSLHLWSGIRKLKPDAVKCNQNGVELLSKSTARIPLLKAIFLIIFSLIFVSGSAFVGLLYLHHLQHARTHDSRYVIAAIVHSATDGVPLPTSLLAEILDLSVDDQKNLYAFDSTIAETNLLHCCAIKNAKIKKVLPNKLYVNYSLRQPIAYITDYSNAALDAEGVLIPFAPFYTPKNIPKFRFSFTPEEEQTMGFSASGCFWGAHLHGPKIKLAFDVLLHVQNNFPYALFTLESIDVSNAFNPSWGERQIVIAIQEAVEIIAKNQAQLVISPRLLRLPTEGYEKQLANYTILREHLNKKLISDANHTCSLCWKSPQMIIDMRIDELAFIKGVE